jgi:hypothetical protein
MRDTELLRRRLWAQLGLATMGIATTAMLSACDGGREVTPVKQASKADDGKQAQPKQAEAKQAEPKQPEAPEPDGDDDKPDQVVPNYAAPKPIDDIRPGEFDYYGPPRDPFNDHDEEEGCPAGDWCGTPDDARKFAVPHVPEQMGCPSKIIAAPEAANALDKTDERWKGFSFHPMMQGRLVATTTQEQRDAGKADVCCYHWFEYCAGRPLLDGEDMLVASLREGASWSCDPSAVAAPDDRPDAALPQHLRERLGQLWVDDALMEHAAIGAFERATLELMAMAAPPSLLAELQVAAADEVEHAMACFGLAARFSGLAREPGPLTALEPRVVGLAGRSEAELGRDWIRLALDTFVEGCVGETIATLIAKRGQRRCEDPATHALLGRIVDDEGRHAGLAWQTIDWILVSCGEHREQVLAALAQQAEALAAQARLAAEQLPEPDPDAELLARFGRCDRRTELRARVDAWTDLILPTLAALTHTHAEPEAWTRA